MARAPQRGPVEGPGSQAGNILHLDCTTVGPELRLPELDIPPYAGLQALNVCAHVLFQTILPRVLTLFSSFCFALWLGLPSHDAKPNLKIYLSHEMNDFEAFFC